MPSLRGTLALWCVCPLLVCAQATLTGRTVDARTGEPLAFVNVGVEGSRDGTVTDIDGRFALHPAAWPVPLRFSYVGYDEVRVQAIDATPLIVRLAPRTELLREAVVLPGENPAHRIIRRVWEGRKANDGMRYRSHRYRSYSKTIFTAEVDSALRTDTARMAALDSSDREAIGFFDRQHILLIESATRKSFDPPDAEREEVLAMRVSGLQDPSLLALVASTKSFSIYEPQITLNEKTYVGPIGPNSTHHYFFQLEDTLYLGADSVFVISYRPRKGTKFDGLKGLLYVNTDGYALQNAIAEPAAAASGPALKVQQMHERVGGKWFPVQLNTWIFLPFMQVNDYTLLGIGRTYLKDIELDVEVDRKEVRGPDFVADRMEVRRDDAFWDALRVDSLDSKELRTYQVIDSVGEAEHLDRKVKTLDALTSGRIPWGPVDFDLTRFLAYNGYEGVRLGAGLRTNARVSRVVSVGGYGAYGFTDRVVKYGGDLRVKPAPARSFELRAFYENDVVESGGVGYRGQRAVFLTDALRLFYMDRMDRIERWGGEVGFRRGGLQAWIGSDRQVRLNEQGYHYVETVVEGITRFTDLFTAGGVYMALRYAHKERVARLVDRQIALGTKWPILYVNVYKAVPDLWKGELDLLRVDAMVEKTFRIRMLGTSTLRIMGGWADGAAPYSWLFNMRGTHGSGLNVATPMAFETMRPNAFLADRYAAVFFRHSFGHLLVKGKHFDPIPSVVAAAGWGDLEDPEVHRGYTFASPDKGHYEAGLQVDQLLKLGFSGFGVGAFQRLGPLATGTWQDDLVLKISATFVL